MNRQNMINEINIVENDLIDSIKRTTKVRRVCIATTTINATLLTIVFAINMFFKGSIFIFGMSMISLSSCTTLCFGLYLANSKKIKEYQLKLDSTIKTKELFTREE
ncbi:MAG: hypothetical protein ACRCX2_05965 [Paraclostridium sp.]